MFTEFHNKIKSTVNLIRTFSLLTLILKVCSYFVETDVSAFTKVTLLSISTGPTVLAYSLCAFHLFLLFS